MVGYGTWLIIVVEDVITNLYTEVAKFYWNASEMKLWECDVYGWLFVTYSVI